MFTVRGHFSHETWVDGRKSISDGDKAVMKYDRSERAMAIINEYRASAVRSLDPEADWIFKSIHGTQVQDDNLAESWRVARSSIEE